MWNTVSRNNYWRYVCWSYFLKVFWCFLMFWSCHLLSRFEGQPQRHQGRCICEKSRWRTGHFNRRDQFSNKWSRIHQLLINISNDTGSCFFVALSLLLLCPLSCHGLLKSGNITVFRTFFQAVLGQGKWRVAILAKRSYGKSSAGHWMSRGTNRFHGRFFGVNSVIYGSVDLWIQIFELRQTFPILSMSFQFQIHQSLKFSGLSHNTARKSFATRTLRTQHSSHLQVYMLAPCPL